MATFLYGARITWQYTHHLGRGTVERVKSGVFIGKVKHTSRYWKYNAPQLVYVQFDDNKGKSKVPFEEIRHE